ncbi:hypothetical protein Tcan_13438 [Toxocara canis]|uniref:Uncharacterized protein n=2 Tax=Toxocara canis TaxID=6265 RepID=A0A0B2W0S1_TOXCA|nr:hypothetical protein Tcan_13438 [Toxocara canis]VDM40269.1 unnamed protein product [Toxocara canis]
MSGMCSSGLILCCETLESLWGCVFVVFVAPLVVVVGCSTRMETREQIEAPKSVEVMSFNEIDEQGREAWYRHLRQTWKPQLVLRQESITCENYETAKERLNFRKHPITAPPLNLQPPLPYEQRHVKLEDVCDVFFIYDDDSCRDQPDEDELTQDLPEEFQKPLKKIVKTSKDGDKAEERGSGNHQEAAKEQNMVAVAGNELDSTHASTSESSLPIAKMDTA